MEQINMKYIFVETQKERQDAGVWLDEFIVNPVSEQHAIKYIKRKTNYIKLINKNNKNHISICTKIKGKYKYCVEADCIYLKINNKEVAFSLTACLQIQKWLELVNHKTNCIFDFKRGNVLIYADFDQWINAVNFATFLSDLDHSCYIDVKCYFLQTN